jgi:cellobiose phosphorylase
MAKRSSTRPGKSARRSGRPQLWSFNETDDGSFTMHQPHRTSGLYFPLMNRHGMKCSITPELKGDICADFQHYLTIPVVTEDLHRSNNSRNFWIYAEGYGAWSATGVSAEQAAFQWDDDEPAELQAGLGYFTLTRTNRELDLEATTTTFVPADDEYVEVLKVTLRNVGRKTLKLTPTAATPIFGRQADNLRDHRQVTTMFQRVSVTADGVIVKPSIVHDETGHRPNTTMYAVLGRTGTGSAPKQIWGNLRAFCGEGGNLLNPRAVAYRAKAPRPVSTDLDAHQAVGAIGFSPVTLKPGQSRSYIVLHAIADDARTFARFRRRYADEKKVDKALAKTQQYWLSLIDRVKLGLADRDVNNWFRWVAFQAICREVFGNSYLPDFGYGRGGRGWRDLWSDLMGLYMLDPAGARDEIVNNFRGNRVDGTNATIVGTKPGEFVADRNNIPRAWSDHQSWPFLITKFYIDQSGDFDVLLTDLPYWKDHLTHRSRRRDARWSRDDGFEQTDTRGQVYRGTILEHMLIGALSSFFHTGDHNVILLEGGDWNDTYDNARERGETVCFSSFYAWVLREMAELLEHISDHRGVSEVELLEEMLMLLDRLPGGRRVDYDSSPAKRRHLDKYMDKVAHRVSGRRKRVKLAHLVKDLRAKADWLAGHIRKREFIRTTDGQRFFNGHYDDEGRRVHGNHPNGVRIDLTSQVLPTMFDIATDRQAEQAFEAVQTYLRNREVGGLHLCSDFGEVKLDFGRVTGFVYGYKEHGGIWNQQNIMYMNALYHRRMVREGYETFRDVFNLCMDTTTSKVLPNLPSFFDINGQGSYCYLTGSATWLVVTMVCEVFGVRGERGDLRLDPKLVKEQFDDNGRAVIETRFADRHLRVTYTNPRKLDFGRYAIDAVTINGRPVEHHAVGHGIRIDRADLVAACTKKLNDVEVTLAAG